jgi:hypothetical protein
VGERDCPLVAAHFAANYHHGRQSTGGGREVGRDSAKTHSPVEEQPDAGRDDNDKHDHRHQAGNPAAGGGRGVGCKGAAEHDTEDRNDDRAQPPRSLERCPGEGRSSGEDHRPDHPSQGHVPFIKQPAADGAQKQRQEDWDNDGGRECLRKFQYGDLRLELFLDDAFFKVVFLVEQNRQ